MRDNLDEARHGFFPSVQQMSGMFAACAFGVLSDKLADFLDFGNVAQLFEAHHLLVAARSKVAGLV